LPEPLYLEPQSFQNGTTVDAIRTNRDDTVKSIWPQLIKSRLPAEVAKQPVLSPPALPILVEFVPTVAGRRDERSPQRVQQSHPGMCLEDSRDARGR